MILVSSRVQVLFSASPKSIFWKKKTKQICSDNLLITSVSFSYYFKIIYGKALGRLGGHGRGQILQEENLHFVCLFSILMRFFIV